ncbi:MAG TPA: hypothetical protein VMU84_17685 [Thermoanaerobaculia bacterium]|nr:hypothetical protein [Thermoanaerobaculia bacterium]
MIDRFNFYDIYGYLIPGMLLIALIWLPHAVVAGAMPSAAVTAAVAALIAAYIAGHVLQVLATKVIPINTGAGGRFPSDWMLDEDDSTFPSALKKSLADAIKTRFGLDVRNHAPSRRTAFFLCRDALIAAKTTPYVEQFQGLYALMRGICAASAIGCAYQIGWLWSPWICEECRVPAAGFTMILLLLAVFLGMLHGDDRTALGGLVLFLFAAAGTLTANGLARHTGVLSAGALSSLTVAILTFGAYLSFAAEWVKTIYRGFVVLATSKST